MLIDHEATNIFGGKVHSVARAKQRQSRVRESSADYARGLEEPHKTGRFAPALKGVARLNNPN
jgi:hypothetical protein